MSKAIFSSYTLTDATVKAEAATVGDKAIAFLKAPVTFGSDTGVSNTTQAINVLGWGGIAFLGGELLGHRRAAQGLKAFIPIGRP